MKYTGITVMIIGLIILLFSGVMGMQSTPVSTSTSDPTQATTSLVPMFFGIAAILGGFLMLAFGGRGYFQSRNPAVRN